MSNTKIKTGLIEDGAVTSAKLDTNIAIDGNLTVDTDTLFVDSADNRVGIGTLNPQTKLQVDSASDFSIALSKRASTTSAIKFTLSDPTATSFTWKLEHDEFENLNLFGYSDDDLVISTNSTERMRIDSSGNVGIGTTSPTNANLVIGKASGAARIAVQRTNSNTTGAFGQFGFQNLNGEYVSGMVALGDGNDAGSHLVFHTTSNAVSTDDNVFELEERMRIDSGGKVGIGTTNPSELLGVAGNIVLDASSARLKLKGGIMGTNSGIDWTFNTESTKFARIDLDYNDRSSVGLLIDSGYPITMDYSASYWRVRKNGAEQMRLTDGADLHVDGDVVAYSTTISDKRLKDNVKTIDNALETIEKLRGVSYVWNNGKRKNQKDIGLIAQEVEKVIPEIVHDKKMPLIDDEVYKTIDYEKLIGVLIESVKELSAEVKELRSQINI